MCKKIRTIGWTIFKFEKVHALRVKINFMKLLFVRVRKSRHLLTHLSGNGGKLEILLWRFKLSAGEFLASSEIIFRSGGIQTCALKKKAQRILSKTGNEFQAFPALSAQLLFQLKKLTTPRKAIKPTFFKHKRCQKIWLYALWLQFYVCLFSKV